MPLYATLLLQTQGTGIEISDSVYDFMLLLYPCCTFLIKYFNHYYI